MFLGLFISTKTTTPILKTIKQLYDQGDIAQSQLILLTIWVSAIALCTLILWIYLSPSTTQTPKLKFYLHDLIGIFLYTLTLPVIYNLLEVMFSR